MISFRATLRSLCLVLVTTFVCPLAHGIAGVPFEKETLERDPFEPVSDSAQEVQELDTAQAPPAKTALHPTYASGGFTTKRDKNADAKDEVTDPRTFVRRARMEFSHLLPFGIGQFAQRRYLPGTVFLGSESLLFGLSYAYYQASQDASRSLQEYQLKACPTNEGLCDQAEVEASRQKIKNATGAMLLTGWSAVLVTVTGVVEAWINHPESRSLVFSLKETPVSNMVANSNHTSDVDQGRSWVVDVTWHF